MGSQKKIGTLVVLLIIVIALIGFLYVQKSSFSQNMMQSTLKSSNGTFQYVELTKEVETPNTKTILNEDFRFSKSNDGKVIITSKDGSIYEVEEGVVLIDDNIIRVSQYDAEIIVLENRDNN